MLRRAGGKLACTAVLLLAGGGRLAAQIPRDQVGVQREAEKTPRTAAPKDLTGYWISVVTELWRYRMIVPDKNDFQFVPLNPEGRKVADTWDPAKDQAAGLACKSYAAPAIMQVPGRIHVYWQDDNTLRIDTDSGTQTRLFHFGGKAPENESAELAGILGGVVGGAGVRGHARRARRARARFERHSAAQKNAEAGGLSQGGYDPSAAGLFTEEWRSLQRQRDARRVLRHV